MAILLLVSAGAPAWAAKPKAQPELKQCSAPKDIEGTYQCGGECLVPASAAANVPLELKPVKGEVSRVALFPGSTQGSYQVSITGENDFRELEVGALVGNTMSTATAQVSDNKYPVLEEYTFQQDASCKTRSYTKTVRGLSVGSFKSCVVQCTKAK